MRERVSRCLLCVHFAVTVIVKYIVLLCCALLLSSAFSFFFVSRTVCMCICVWMLTCDSIFQIIDMEMKWTSFFLFVLFVVFFERPFEMPTVSQQHSFSLYYAFDAIVLLSHFSFSLSRSYLCLPRRRSTNAQFMSKKNVNWHESNECVCAVQQSS